MTFFPLSLKALAILAIAALGVAVVLTRLESIDSAVLGAEWECHKTAFVITTCALRSQRQAVPASLETARADRYIFGPIR
jgi:hypothetical protein